MNHISLDRLTGLIAFARAASLGSYTAAARALSISPSAVSKSIMRLEERLGVKLFNRTTRTITLTPEGRELFQHALRLLQEAEEIEQAAFAARTEPSGTLKVTAPFSIGIHLIAAHLPAFRERYPKISIDFRLSDTFSDLIEESIDLAVRVGPMVDSRLIARKLATNIACTYATTNYLKKKGIPGSVGELDLHELVCTRYQSSGQLVKWLFRIDDELIEYVPRSALTVTSTDTALTVICNDGGIGLLPTYVAHPYVERGELVPVLSVHWVARNDITAYWPESRRGNPNVRVFLDFLSEIFPNPAPWNILFNDDK